MSLKRPREDQDDTDLSNSLASSSSLVSPSEHSSQSAAPPIKRPRQEYDQPEHSFLGSLFFSAVGVVRGMIGANPRRAPTHSEMRVQRRMKEGTRLSVGARNVEAQPTGILKELLATTTAAEKSGAGGDSRSAGNRTRSDETSGSNGGKGRAQRGTASRLIYPTPESSQELDDRGPSSSASGSRTGYPVRSETDSTPLLFPPSSHSSFSDLSGHAADQVRGTASQPVVVSDDEDDESGAKTTKRTTLANGPPAPTTPARPPPRRPDLSGHTAPTHTYDWLTLSDAGSSTSARSRSSSTASLRRTKRTASAKLGSPKERAQRKVVNLTWLAGILSDEGDQEGARAIRKELKYVKAGLASASSPSKTIGRLWSKAKKAGGDEKDLYAALLSGPRTLDSVLHKPKPEVFSPELSMKKADYAKSRTAQIRTSSVDDIVENFSKAHLAEEAKIKKALDKTVPTPTRMAPERAGEVAAHLRDANFDFRILDKGLRQRDLVTLKPTQWLNDEVINTYLTMVRVRSDGANGADGLKDVFEMSTFFYQKLSQQGYEKAKLARWTKRAKVDIFAKDLILIPVNIGGMHWTAAAINNVARRIEYYDSMGDRGGHRTQVFSNLRQYLREEHQNKKSAPFNEDGWTDHFIAGTPQQDNGSDCGVFTCQTLEALARGRDLTDTSAWDFGHRNMPYIRQLMVLEFGQGKLEKRWPKEQ